PSAAITANETVNHRRTLFSCSVDQAAAKDSSSQGAIRSSRFVLMIPNSDMAVNSTRKYPKSLRAMGGAYAAVRVTHTAIAIPIGMLNAQNQGATESLASSANRLKPQNSAVLKNEYLSPIPPWMRAANADHRGR